ncbi:MAG: two-component system LytT family sensor kinase [Polaribacter sp.]|jgi:two-component system LytT family sensor kinase
MNKGLINSSKHAFLHLFFWFIVWVFFKTFFSVGTSNTQFIFWFSILLSAISIVASYVFVYDLLPNYLLKKRYKEFLLYTIYAGVFITFGVFMTMAFGFIFYFNLEFQNMPALTKSYSVILVCVLFIVVLTSGIKILSHNYKSLEKNKSLENKILQAQLELKEQELKFLKMQIHPHFLFNSLNTIYGFALKKKDETPKMILKLSNLLDYILYQVDKSTVNLQDEINHLEDYISLEEMRFNDTLSVNFQKENINAFLLVAPMLLIPFLENSFKHGKIIDGKMKVDIQLFVENDFLFFNIENSSDIKSKANNGIGMENIKKRLEMLYPNAYSLVISEAENKFIVALKVNIESLKRESNV